MKVKDSILNDPSTVRASLNGVDSGNDMANKIIQLQYDKVNFTMKMEQLIILLWKSITASLRVK